jgi:hypothetical protein
MWSLKWLASPQVFWQIGPGLGHLSLHNMDLAPRVGSICSLFNEKGEDGQDVQGLLAAVGCLTQLQHLQLHLWLKKDTILLVGVLQLFASLTASSHLTSVSLDKPGFGSMGLPLPEGAAQYAFPEGRVLFHLQELSISGKPRKSGGWCLDSSHIDRLGRCCPHVVTLRLLQVVKPLSSMQGLLGMRGSLQDLALSGHVGDDAAAVVLHLTRLTSLKISSYTLTTVGLKELTVLRALQHLEVENWASYRFWEPLAVLLHPNKYLLLTTTLQVRSAAHSMLSQYLDALHACIVGQAVALLYH